MVNSKMEKANLNYLDLANEIQKGERKFFLGGAELFIDNGRIVYALGERRVCVIGFEDVNEVETEKEWYMDLDAGMWCLRSCDFRGLRLVKIEYYDGEYAVDVCSNKVLLEQLKPLGKDLSSKFDSWISECK